MTTARDLIDLPDRMAKLPHMARAEGTAAVREFGQQVERLRKLLPAKEVSV